MTKRDRVETVLRVRRVQEMQAAGELARASVIMHEAEAQLEHVRDRYEEGRVIDEISDLVPPRLRDREARLRQAEAIQRGRERVKAAMQSMTERREVLMASTQAVKAMERLDERLGVEEEAEQRRLELRELDDRAVTVAAAGRDLL